jgi:folylpolyglutamate synthase/dihydropteroate synthase
MRIEIETYRGWQISFDTDKETFYAQSDEYDRGETKKSFASAKAYVDDFIKTNVEFKPVWVETIPSHYQDRKKVKIIGIRKDKRFVIEGKNGEKEQLSEYSEKDYILVNAENETFYSQMANCNTRIKAIEQERKAIEEKIIKKGLAEIKRQYTL